MTRPNGVSSNYTYDNLSRLLSVLHQIGGNTVDGATYTVDAVGNRTAKTNHLSSVTDNYTYDAIYQLTQAVQGMTTTETYTYDQVGNRLSSLGVSPYTYNSSNHLTSTPATTFTYDNNGNTTGKTVSAGTTAYQWDYENRLLSVTPPGSQISNFKYDPFGRRIQKVSPQGTTIYVYDGANIIEEVDASGTVLARYTQGQGIDEPLTMLRSGVSSYYEADGLGSITSLTDSAGAVAASYTYDSFGILTASTGSLINPYRYTAREFDPETGLYFYRARYFDQIPGRFLSEDPIRFQGSKNFYSYVGNRPTFFTDPLGLFNPEDHFDMTYVTALAEFGPGCESQARKLAEANVAQDPPWYLFFDPKAWKKPGTHFPGMEELNALDEGIANCDLNLFGKGLHSLQDSFSHAGLPAGPFGYVDLLVHGLVDSFPNRHNKLENAKALTRIYARNYKIRCLKCCAPAK